ncbi:hypothetical protein GJ496_001103 [Pomphorhynchus laevis]|nr:hypothetical protein GJ496_001103 [Pomphorhynchus laevis]
MLMKNRMYYHGEKQMHCDGRIQITTPDYPTAAVDNSIKILNQDLYIVKASLFHSGTYSCHCLDNDTSIVNQLYTGMFLQSLNTTVTIQSLRLHERIQRKINKSVKYLLEVVKPSLIYYLDVKDLDETSNRHYYLEESDKYIKLYQLKSNKIIAKGKNISSFLISQQVRDHHLLVRSIILSQSCVIANIRWTAFSQCTPCPVGFRRRTGRCVLRLFKKCSNYTNVKSLLKLLFLRNTVYCDSPSVVSFLSEEDTLLLNEFGSFYIHNHKCYCKNLQTMFTPAPYLDNNVYEELRQRLVIDKHVRIFSNILEMEKLRSILASKDNPPQVRSLQLLEGQKNISIPCLRSNPRSNMDKERIHWIKQNKRTFNIWKNQYTLINTSRAVLTFPVVLKNVSGLYICYSGSVVFDKILITVSTEKYGKSKDNLSEYYLAIVTFWCVNVIIFALTSQYLNL